MPYATWRCSSREMFVKPSTKPGQDPARLEELRHEVLARQCEHALDQEVVDDDVVDLRLDVLRVVDQALAGVDEHAVEQLDERVAHVAARHLEPAGDRRVAVARHLAIPAVEELHVPRLVHLLRREERLLLLVLVGHDEPRELASPRAPRRRRTTTGPRGTPRGRPRRGRPSRRGPGSGRSPATPTAGAPTARRAAAASISWMSRPSFPSSATVPGSTCCVSSSSVAIVSPPRLAGLKSHLNSGFLAL